VEGQGVAAIARAFCTLMLADVDEKMSGAFMARAKRRACAQRGISTSASLEGLRTCSSAHLLRDLLLLLLGECREGVVLRANEERDGRLRQRVSKDYTIRRAMHTLLKPL
jgi:ATP-dependent RNA circularization protein (DNA/RNA ligase family)